ncbi:MAG: division/cell wall cluster transcriptional repressor MraZ [Deltaproteobacteria bacterium]|nr:division/cell wall cluster transcriptional repressor MraZ [Deltaproteobacteria bacterium]
MFRGRFNHNIDAKGRLNFPAKFREVFADNFEEKLILVKHNRCLRAYPLSVWKTLEETKFNQFRTPDQEAVFRWVLGSMAECGFDKQGRILIPQDLRNHADLSRETVVVGMLNRIEVWNRQRWEEEVEGRVQETLNVEEALQQLGL